MIEKLSNIVGTGKGVRRIINHPWFVGIAGSIIGGILLYFLLEKPDIFVEIYKIVWKYITIPRIIITVFIIVIGIALIILFKRKIQIKKHHGEEVILGENLKREVTIPSAISGLCLGRDTELVTLEKRS